MRWSEILTEVTHTELLAPGLTLLGLYEGISGDWLISPSHKHVRYLGLHWVLDPSGN